MEQQETAILIASIVLVVIIILLIFLFLIFQKRKNSLLLQQREAKREFERAIAQTQIEIREETLRNISWELHDNIGQLLTLAKIQIGIAQGQPEKLQEVTDTITKSLTELRSLSKLINPDAIKSLSLSEAIRLEIERFNRLQFIEASMTGNSEVRKLDSQEEIVLFRILQEFFTNTIKHSKATKLTVHTTFTKDKIEIKAEDNGVGFDITNTKTKQGIGLCNIQNRGKLIGAEIGLHSEIGKGTSIKLVYFYKQKPETSPKLSIIET
ncbi:sensor histidine kinase [Aquimarina brevivitae]|uniref:histidine kinase n=1 Tax=Aquimarina brevivitae TaxID=323412 RepID=A0A4Q7PJ31_9FLAO|nr:ATP-binding protein [Aquimarina brevivitae]RZS98922.1 histidine kinase/DNA gyrase B/HSP90-like ATPase [Aquimarina brevivitae]